MNPVSQVALTCQRSKNSFRRAGRSPQVAQLVSAGDEQALQSHRREVSIVVCDLRNFTAFAESAEPEEVIGVLREYHTTLGALIDKFDGTVERFAGDGLLVLFNDPLPCPAFSVRAVQMALEMRAEVAGLAADWRARAHELGFGMGIANGYATLGCIGFKGRLQYSATGTVANLASRLCDHALDGPGELALGDPECAPRDGELGKAITFESLETGPFCRGCSEAGSIDGR